MQPSPDLDWDHLRVFLAVMRVGSMRQAADLLGVSHPTIRRRLESLEEELGLSLFDRGVGGLSATPQAAELMELAEDVEASVHALGRRALDAAPELKGPIRVSAPDLLVTDLLMPELVAFDRRWPQIELQVDGSYEIADLRSREADVAIRAVPHGQSPTGEVAGRLAAVASAAIYGCDHQWIGWKSEAEDRPWIEETPYPDLPIRGRLPTVTLQRAACAEGMGLTQLPCFFAEPLLQRRTEPKPHSDIWVLVHPDLRRSPRLRVFRDEIVAALKTLEPRLAGRQ